MSRIRTFPVTFTCRYCGIKGPRPSNQYVTLVLPGNWSVSTFHLVKDFEPVLELTFFICENCLKRGKALGHD
jgi:hypothetical protein